MVLFLDGPGLVDADGVDPERPDFAPSAQIHERRETIGRDPDTFSAAVNEPRNPSSAPDVRQCFVGIFARHGTLYENGAKLELDGRFHELGW